MVTQSSQTNVDEFSKFHFSLKMLLGLMVNLSLLLAISKWDGFYLTGIIISTIAWRIYFIEHDIHKPTAAIIYFTMIILLNIPFFFSLPRGTDITVRLLYGIELGVLFFSIPVVSFLFDLRRIGTATEFFPIRYLFEVFILYPIWILLCVGVYYLSF